MTFTFNRWVRGEDFYGRAQLLADIKQRGARPTWLLGNRRVGKTSTLRQIEWLCRKGDWPGMTALYWDLQGAGSVDGLKEALLEALEDAEEVTDALGLDIDALEDLSFVDLINRFRRKVKSLDGSFLLLIDECEEIVDVAGQDPGILASFRKLSHTRSCGIIMAGSLRLMDLDETASRTSPFLPDFLPPVLLGPFSEEESISLLTNNELSVEGAKKVHDLTFGNPHLTQVLGEFAHRLGNLEQALFDLNRDKVCDYFFQSNFQCMPEHMRNWWKDKQAVAQLKNIQATDPNLPYLEQASIIRNLDGQLQISPLLEMAEKDAIPTPAAAPRTIPQSHATKPQSQPKSDQSIVTFLNTLKTKSTELSVIPMDRLKSGDIQDLTNPEALNDLAAKDTSANEILEILRGASPEYTLDQKPDERTAVYLAGLFLHYKWLNSGLFQDIKDPWLLSGAIADQDGVITPDQVKHSELAPQRAMIIMRCLMAKPAMRYASIDDLAKDLGSY